MLRDAMPPTLLGPLVGEIRDRIDDPRRPVGVAGEGRIERGDRTGCLTANADRSIAVYSFIN